MTLPAAAACGDDGGVQEAGPAEPTATTLAPDAFADAVRAGDLEAMHAAVAPHLAEIDST